MGIPRFRFQARRFNTEMEGDQRSSSLFDRKRVLRIAAVVIVAGAAGQVQQSMQGRSKVAAAQSADASDLEILSAEIVALSGKNIQILPKPTPDEMSLPDQACTEPIEAGIESTEVLIGTA